MYKDLEAYRRDKGLSYRKLGALIGCNHAGQTRSWALGEVWPDADKLQRIVEATQGAVTVDAMHRRRLAHLAETKGFREQRHLALQAAG